MRGRIVLSRGKGRSAYRVVTIVAAAAMLSTLGLAACGTNTETSKTGSPEQTAGSVPIDLSGDADSLMAQAKTLARKSNDLAGALWEQGQMMEVVLAPNAAAAEREIAKAKSMVDDMSAAQEAIVTLLDQVVRLDVSEALTTYSGQQREIAELQLLAIAANYDLLEEIGAFYLENDRPAAEADLEKLFREMEPSDPDDPLAHLEDKGEASREFFRQSGLPDRYYINNGLGEAYDTPDWQYEEEAAGFPLADGISFEEGPGAVDEGAGPPQASFEMPLAEAMRAQRAALEAEGWSVKVTSSGDTRGVLTAHNEYWEATFTFKKSGGGAGTVDVRMKEL